MSWAGGGRKYGLWNGAFVLLTAGLNRLTMTTPLANRCEELFQSFGQQMNRLVCRGAMTATPSDNAASGLPVFFRQRL